MQGRSNLIHQSLAASLLSLALASGCASSQRTAPSGTSATPQAQTSPELQEASALDEKIGNLYRAGKFPDAIPLAQRSLELKEKVLGPDHPIVATSLNNLAALYQATGQYAQAEPLYQRTLAISEKALGPDHPNVAMSLNNLAFLAGAQHRYPLAISFLQKGLETEEHLIRDVFRITTEAQKLLFVQSISGAYEAYLSLIHQHLSQDRTVIRKALGMVLRRKGIVFDAQARTQAAGQAHMSDAAWREWERLSALRGELARLLLNKPEKMSIEAYKERLALLQQQIEETERSLARQSPLVAEELAQRSVTAETMAKLLPKDAALVEFVRLHDFDFTMGQGKPTARYLAFVLTPGGEVTLVDLGEASVIDQQIGQALEALKLAQQRQNRPAIAQSLDALAALSQQLWAPLQGAIGSAPQLILSPDGLLTLVPFAALPNADGRFLLESHRLAYVTSGRELIRGTGSTVSHPSELVLVANPAYDDKRSGAGEAVAALRSRDFRNHFSPLPGTEREAQEIPPLISAEPAKKQVAVGQAATEALVKSTKSPRILHLATHGFFLEDKPLPIETLRGGFGSLQPTPVISYENPLVRSGLAFAGANQATQVTEGDDGILTALEVTGMDLHGTDLVVLSACETAVGTVQTGEGVFGLRRAFALAGAKNLLMSLWPVDDALTAEQMKAFYRNLQTLPPGDALRQAQLASMQTLKERFGVANPGLWAPFILQGAHAFGN